MELGPWEFLMSVNGRPAFVGPHLDELLNLAEEYVADDGVIYTDSALGLDAVEEFQRQDDYPMAANPRRAVGQAFRELQQATEEPEQTSARNMPQRALEASGLGTVSLEEINDMTSGLRDGTAALERLDQYVGHLAPQWRDPKAAVAGMLTSNSKTHKVVYGEEIEIRGLALVPYWRHLYARDVRGLSDMEDLYQAERAVSPKGTKRDHAHSWCVGSDQTCRRACLVTTGRNLQIYAMQRKYALSEALRNDPAAFCSLLMLAVRHFQTGAAGRDQTALVRLNVLSDLPWEIICPSLFEQNPLVQFYDYTKVAGRAPPRNYDLSFSFSGSNDTLCRHELERGRRVVVVFAASDLARQHTIPTAYSRLPRDEMAKLRSTGGRLPAARERELGGKLSGRLTFAEVTDYIGRDAVENPFGARVGRVPLVDGDSDDFRPGDPPRSVMIGGPGEGGESPSIVGLIYKDPKSHGAGEPAEARKRRLELRSSAFVTLIPVRRMGEDFITAQVPGQTSWLRWEDPDNR